MMVSHTRTFCASMSQPAVAAASLLDSVLQQLQEYSAQPRKLKLSAPIFWHSLGDLTARTRASRRAGTSASSVDLRRLQCSRWLHIASPMHLHTAH
jgi:hypothetical protein